MEFRLSFTPKALLQKIHHQHHLLLVGSCFTENIGEKLKQHKFTVLDNPNGILFNPVSVAEAVTSYVENKPVTETDLFCYNEAWHSWKHHSRFSGLTAAAAVAGINAANTAAHRFLQTADHLFITLGSAWTYALTDKAQNGKPGSVAANNHKAPADWFVRKLMAYEDVLSVLDNMIHRLFMFNDKLKIIFTISPVRHLREGFVENNRSKAVLIQAVHHLVDKFDRLHYFPAYELVIDDLRDYRFYAEDMVHPNYAATNYVWEKLVSSCMTDDTQQLMKIIQEINTAKNHKAFNPGSQAHRQFLQTYGQKVKMLQQQYPYLDFGVEVEYFGEG